MAKDRTWTGKVWIDRDVSIKDKKQIIGFMKGYSAGVSLEVELISAPDNIVNALDRLAGVSVAIDPD